MPERPSSVMDELIHDLQKRIAGEVRFDEMTKVLYSTDASIYEIEPLGVVIPKTPEDAITTMEICGRYGVPILPRGGGTALAGQAVGRAIHLHMSKYLNTVLEVNAEERWARIQPGIVLDELNAQLRSHGLWFAPDASTIRTRTLTDDELQAKLRAPDLEGDLYRAVHRLTTTHRDEIIRRYPKIMRRVGGYALDAFVNGKPFNLSSLEYARQMTFVQGNPGALLLVEYYGKSREELAAKLDRLESHLKRLGIGIAFTRTVTPEETQKIWKVRKAGLGLLMAMTGDEKPIAGIEDTAVPPERLAEYIRRLDEMVRAHGTQAAYYGHASVGCLHIRPIIDLKGVTEVEKLRSIATKVCELVMEYGGANSAEHGDGLARSCFNEKFFGPTLYRAFKELKATADPKAIMNPGKIVDAPLMTENLRYGGKYRARQVQTIFRYAREGGFDQAIEMCNGAAVPPRPSIAGSRRETAHDLPLARAPWSSSTTAT